MMKSRTTLFVSIILSALVAFAVAKFVAPAQTAGEAKNETSYERVVRTQTLRCGYQYWDGAVMRDPQSNKIYGPWVEIMETIGKVTGLKIEWVEQVGWDSVSAALKANKIDAMCAGMWTSAAKAKEISFSTPLAYQAIGAFVRADDHRYDGDRGKLNNENVNIGVIDNDNSDFIARQDFPKAKRLSLSQNFGNDGDLLMELMHGKSDVTFVVDGLWQQFDKSNPGKTRELHPGLKIRVFGLANAINNDDPRLLTLLNAGGQEIQNSGELDKILDKANAEFPDMFIKPLKPFP